MKNNYLCAAVFSMAFAACIPASAQCEIYAQVTKTAARQDGNHMLSRVMAWASAGDWWNWYATVNGQLWFTPTGGTQYVVASGSQSGYLWGGTDYRNPTWSVNEVLEPRGNGQYFTRGWATFVSACMTGGTIPPADSPKQTIARPVISMDRALWFLGEGIPTYVGLTTTATFALDKKGATETPGWSIVAGNEKLELSCSSCANPVGTARGGNTICGGWNEIRVKANVNGFSSEEYLVFINRPYAFGSGTTAHWPYPDGGLVGYISQISYSIKELCDNTIYVPVNETLSPAVKDNPQANWPFDSIEEGSWQSFDYDSIYAAGPVGHPYIPVPRVPDPGATCVVQVGQKVAWKQQEFRAGSAEIGKGALVQRNRLQWFEDHGCHEAIQSPAQ